MFVAGSLWLGDTCGAVLEQLLASTVILASRAFEPVLFAHHATFLLLQMSYVHQTMEHSGNVVGIVSSTLAIYAEDELPADAEPGAIPAADFQMGLNMCVPAADILRLVGGPGKGEHAVPR